MRVQEKRKGFWACLPVVLSMRSGRQWADAQADDPCASALAKELRPTSGILGAEGEEEGGGGGGGGMSLHMCERLSLFTFWAPGMTTGYLLRTTRMFHGCLPSARESRSGGVRF